MFTRLLAVSVAAGLSFSVLAAPATYKLDTAKSALHWKATKVVGGHNGIVKLKDGSLEVENNVPKSGVFTIDFATITSEDLKDDPENKGKLEGHLKSADFFNVPAHPTGTFKLNDIAPIAGKKDEFKVKGELTVKGHSKAIEFPAKITVAANTATATADIKINRLDYDIKYNSGKVIDPKKLGDKMIYDEIEIKLDLTAHAEAAHAVTKPAAKPTKKGAAKADAHAPAAKKQ